MRSKIVDRFLDFTHKIVLLMQKGIFIYSKDKYNFHALSFSQEGEDLILRKIFGDQNSGFYVDVGAHHPQRFSNTYLFYLRGWRGINIDAMPGSMNDFNRIRPHDINLEAAISNIEESSTYYIFKESALNSFSQELSASRTQSNSDDKIVSRKEIYTRRLSSILDEYLPENQSIDFLSIDVEGLDHQVLLSNDWSKYNPSIIVIEELSKKSISDLSETQTFLKNQGYELFARTFNTSFYRLER